MKKIVKQVVGIDMAQDELVVCIGRMYDDLTSELYSHKSFTNTDKGFERLVEWALRLSDSSVEIRYVMEATGVSTSSHSFTPWTMRLVRQIYQTTLNSYKKLPRIVSQRGLCA